MDKSYSKKIAQNLPCWAGPVCPVVIEGGISNENFLVEDNGQKYAVRVNGDVPVHGVSRLNDFNCNTAAATAGIAPQVYHYEPGAIVVDFIESKTLSADDVREDHNLSRIVDLIKRTHTNAFRCVRGPVSAFWPFRVCRDYAFFIAENESSWGDYMPNLCRLNDDLEQAVGAVDIVLGHNDLLAANLLDDGERLWLIDWEHAGLTSPLFDLANLVTNNNLSGAQEADVLVSYFGRLPDDDVLGRFAAMKCASLLREAMWSMVSEHSAVLDFDYKSYAFEYLERLDGAVKDWTRMSGAS